VRRDGEAPIGRLRRRARWRRAAPLRRGIALALGPARSCPPVPQRRPTVGQQSSVLEGTGRRAGVVDRDADRHRRRAASWIDRLGGACRRGPRLPGLPGPSAGTPSAPRIARAGALARARSERADRLAKRPASGHTPRRRPPRATRRSSGRRVPSGTANAPFGRSPAWRWGSRVLSVHALETMSPARAFARCQGRSKSDPVAPGEK
jgi:hypothetical protein